MSNPNPQARVVLVVEDKAVQRQMLESSVQKTGQWRVINCLNSHDVLARLEQLEQENLLPLVASIDLGLDDHPNDPVRGIELLRQIKSRWPSIRLVVHSSLNEITIRAVKKIAMTGASFIYTGNLHDTEDYVQLLDFIATGYLIYSPMPAERVRRVLSAGPDPFPNNPEYWTTLKLLSAGNTLPMIARHQNCGPRQIRNRIRRAAELLHAAKEISLYSLDPDQPVSLDQDEETADFVLADDALESNRDADLYRPFLTEWYLRNSWRHAAE